MNRATPIATPVEDGFLLGFAADGGRTRRVWWRAVGRGEERDEGVVDMGFIRSGQQLLVRCGFEPVKIEVRAVDDATPGVHQSGFSVVPGGVCRFGVQLVEQLSFPINLYVSRTGHPMDTLSVGNIEPAAAGSACELQFSVRDPWIRLFAKKGSQVAVGCALNRPWLMHVPTATSYECLNHLLKAEHRTCAKFGVCGMRFEPAAPAHYAYFSLSFQLA